MISWLWGKVLAFLWPGKQARGKWWPDRPKSPGETDEKEPHRRVSKKKRESFDSWIGDILDLMESTRSEHVKGKRKIKYFDGAIPLAYGDGWADAHSILLNENHKAEYIRPESMHPKYVEDIDVSLLGHGGDGFNTQLSRVRSVKIRGLRGKGLRLPPSNRIVLYSLMSRTESTGKWESIELYMAYINGLWMQLGGAGNKDFTGGNWKTIFGRGWRNSRRERVPIYFEQKSHDSVQLAHSVAFANQYRWSIGIGFVDGLSIQYPTTPRGVQSAFKMRDIPEGKSRRDSLKHWVNSHNRKISRREEIIIETRVRKHLRGQTDFQWGGMDISINVCPYDLELAEKFKIERMAEMGVTYE
jgi:hypothetical protein